MNVTELGLIGHPLGHSLSPFVHQEIMAGAGLLGSYRLYDIRPEELEQKIGGLLQSLTGFNCTIPHKEAVIPYLDRLDETARLTMSVNTIWQRQGFNTDYAGFNSACPLPSGSKVLILGAGGVSRTMAFAAAARNCRIWLVARRAEQAAGLARAVKQHWPFCDIHTAADLDNWQQAAAGTKDWILLNGTPVGLWPRTRQMPIPSHLLGFFKFVYDTIYNPLATRLVLAARAADIRAGNGLTMLFNQALAAQQIWHPQALFPDAALAVAQRKLTRAVLQRFPYKIILTGFMGSGKTTVGQILARQLELPFVDLDKEIENKEGSTIARIFASQGETAFRQMESQQLARVLAQPQSLVLATGGGALLNQAAAALLDETACSVVFLKLDLAEVKARLSQDTTRPLLAGGTAKTAELFASRQVLYQQLADLSVDARPEPGQVAAKITARLGLEEIL